MCQANFHFHSQFFYSSLKAIIMKAIIQKELGLPVVEISDQKATLDGGDVLFTGLCHFLFKTFKFRTFPYKSMNGR